MLAYYIITEKVPFSELSEQISPFDLKDQIINKYRPPFPDFVTEKMKNLISKCWSDSKEKRPTFGEIINELSKDPQSFFY